MLKAHYYPAREDGIPHPGPARGISRGQARGPGWAQAERSPGSVGAECESSGAHRSTCRNPVGRGILCDRHPHASRAPLPDSKGVEGGGLEWANRHASGRLPLGGRCRRNRLDGVRAPGRHRLAGPNTTFARSRPRVIRTCAAFVARAGARRAWIGAPRHPRKRPAR